MTKRLTTEELDDLLSGAQLKLRNGYDDHLSRAVAEARNRLNALATKHSQTCRYHEGGGDCNCHLYFGPSPTKPRRKRKQP